MVALWLAAGCKQLGLYKQGKNGDNSLSFLLRQLPEVEYFLANSAKHAVSSVIFLYQKARHQMALEKGKCQMEPSQHLRQTSTEAQQLAVQRYEPSLSSTLHALHSSRVEHTYPKLFLYAVCMGIG